MDNWLSELVALYSNNSTLGNIWRLFIFCCLVIMTIVSIFRYIKNLHSELVVKRSKGEKIRLDDLIGKFLLLAAILIALVVAILGIIAEILTLKNTL